MTRKPASLTPSYRLAVASRSLAALFGGYLLASTASFCVAVSLPVAPVDATLIGLMLSFVFYVLAFIGCFACRDAWRAWLGVLIPSLVLGLLGALVHWVKLP